MKITNISCTQFAGVRDRNVSFTDGINVVCGKNESGKSTLVNLLSRTLFQKARLDLRSDKEFYELYFPSAKKGSTVKGDFTDGRVTFETENGTYSLTKEWGSDSRCTLSTPDGVIREQQKIDEILKEMLLYGEGVYSDILFSSQRNTDVSLQTILDASKKSDAKQEITNTVSQAFAETGGISIDAIEQAIAEKIDKIAGKHWDFEREAPVRKAGHWAKNPGEILKAYYAFEDAKAILGEISHLESEADRAAKTYTDREVAVCKAEEAYNRFNTFASRLAVQSERRKAVDRIDKELLRIAEVLSNWPRLNEKIEKAKTLQKEKTDRSVVDVWNAVQEIRAEVTPKDIETADLPYPDQAEVSLIKRTEREITSLENKLCGMNLNAAIRMLGGKSIKVTSLRTGEEIDVSNGVAAITEAVRIEIPDVMEMKLSPADVDLSVIERQIAQLQESVAAIFEKYDIETLEELENYAQKIENAKAKIDSVNNRLSRILGSISMKQLEELYQNVGPVNRSKEEIEREICVVCGELDIAKFITKTETVIDGYTAEYGSINDLKAKAFDLDSELKKAKASITDVEDIPAEYLRITDPEVHLNSLQNSLKTAQDLRESALTEKTATASRLDTYKETHPEASVETVERAEREYQETKALLNHWLHIAKVVKEQKEKIDNNPMQDIAENFTRYLGIISGGRVESEFPEADKLNMNIYSDNKLLDYGKLSEGTKETVSLAFRLAVLDHLFPEGGGVIVFDDPFTDMDAERTEQSCELLRECANRHQVIFLTCREEYADMLNGNRIVL